MRAVSKNAQDVLDHMSHKDAVAESGESVKARQLRAATEICFGASHDAIGDRMLAQGVRSIVEYLRQVRFDLSMLRMGLEHIKTESEAIEKTCDEIESLAVNEGRANPAEKSED